MKKDKKQKIIIGMIIGLALALDQITKLISYKQGWNLFYESNDNNGYYIIMSIIIIIMIIRYITTDNSFIKLDTKIILSFAIAGALGNLIDRVWFHSVIVFINIFNSFNLNLSYIYIGIAWIGMAIILTRNSTKFIKDRKNGNKKNRNKK